MAIGEGHDAGGDVDAASPIRSVCHDVALVEINVRGCSLAEDTTTSSMVSRMSICFILGDVAIVERHLIGVADADACSFLVATTVGIGCLVRIYFAIVERHGAVHYVNASSSLVKRSKL